MIPEPRGGQHYLLPGELLVSETPARVSTVLGSCVALTIHAPGRQVGAICHAMLPLGGNNENFRYVDVAVRYLLHSFDRLDIPRSDLVIKLFGGACVLSGGVNTRTPSVGERNIRAALALLQQQGLRPASRDVGGIFGRKLIFYPHTGEVLIKRLAGLPAASLSADRRRAAPVPMQ
jgi:chemotaxis protein CheD